MPPASFLSKSTFIRGVQCEKSLYLHKKRPFLRDRLSDEQRAKFSRGHKVGYLARGLFPGGVDMTPPSHFQMAASIKKTAEMIKQGADVIYEAAFEYQGVRVALDILYNDNGQWKAVEVKSSAAISETFIWDASLQYYVISGSGLALADFSIAYINAGYVRQGDLDLHKMFIIESVADLLAGKQAEVHDYIERFRDVVTLKSSPPIEVGPHCHSPYPCDFIGHCWKHIPAKEWHTFPAHQTELIKKFKAPANISSVVLLSVLCYRPAVPPYNDVSPYQQLPFSLAWRTPEPEGAATTCIHIEPGLPISLDNIKTLRDALQPFRQIIVFDACCCHEALHELAAGKPEMLRMIDSMAGRMQTLLDPFVQEVVAGPDLKSFENPADLVHYYNLPEIPFRGPLKSVLEASQQYLRFTEEAAKDKIISNMSDIEAFQQDVLAQMRQVYLHYAMA